MIRPRRIGARRMLLFLFTTPQTAKGNCAHGKSVYRSAGDREKNRFYSLSHSPRARRELRARSPARQEERSRRAFYARTVHEEYAFPTPPLRRLSFN